ncbi:MAG: Hsp20/alpha crystallin family protein [Candidatus Helarchaeota archaeon]
MAETKDKLAKTSGGYYGWLSPFRGFFDDFFDDFFLKPFEYDFEFPDVRFPLMDLKDEKDKYVLETEIPGLNKDEINIEITKDRIVEIKGEKTEEKESKEDDGKYIHKERSTQSFYRRLHLPSEIDPEKVEAKAENGLLTIIFPKKEPEPVKKVEVK